MARYTIISKFFASNDRHDYAVYYNKNTTDFFVSVIVSKRTITFYKDRSCTDPFYVIDMNIPGYENKPTDEDLAIISVLYPKSAFFLAAHRLKKAVQQGLFPEDFNQYS